MFQKFIPPVSGRQAQNVFQVKINMNLCLQAIKALGINLVNIDANDILSGLLWQVIHQGLNNKIKQQQNKVTVDGKEVDVVKYSDKEFEQLILMWVKEQTNENVNNFGKDFQSGDILYKLMNKVCKDQLIEVDDLNSEQEKTQNEKIQNSIQMMEKVGISLPLRVEDVKSGNEKVMFTILAEIFSVSLNKEMGVGNDNTTQMQKLNVQQILGDKQFVYGKYLDFFEEIPEFDKYRANAQIDFIELTIFITEFMKHINEIQQLQLNDGQYDEITYQLLLSEQLSSQQIMNLQIKAIQLCRDYLDKIYEKLQGQFNEQLINQCFMPIIKYLIVLGTDDIYQTQLIQCDFHYCLCKFQQIQLTYQQKILLAFYFAIMYKITYNKKFSISAQQILTTFKNNDSEVKEQAFQCLLPCIATMVFDQSKFSDQVSASISQKLDKMTRAVWQQIPSIECQTALNMLYSQYHKFKSLKAQAQNFCQASANYLSQLTEIQLLSIITLDTYRMFNNIMQVYPNEIAKLIIKCCQPDDLIGYVMEFDIDEIKDNYSQINLKSKCQLLSTLREFTFNKEADALISKQVQQVLVLPGITNPGQITYKDITENNLANELLRSSARFATYALVKYDLQIVELMTQILDQVSKSSSIVAFRESIKDIGMINQEVKKHQQNMLIIFDLILACTKKYEGNIVVMLDILKLCQQFADDKFFIQSGVFEQIDAMSYDYLKQRRVSIEYLKILNILAQNNYNIYDIAFNSLQKIQQQHESDITVMSMYYQVLTSLNDDRIIQNINFMDDLVQTLGKYSEQPFFVYIIFKCLLKKINYNTELIFICQKKDIFKLVINYTKYIKQTFKNDEYTQQISETAIDILLTGINMINDFNREQTFQDIEKILIM